jgi:thiosulfate/3-mercaptopyruvate sulfurtransferase
VTAYAHPEFLTSAAELATALGTDPGLRVYDCTVYLVPDPPRYRIESGRATYLEGHVPGAGFLDLTGSLSDASSRLGFTLPGAAALETEFRKAGIDDDASHVVLYSKGHVMWATRVWWMLRSAGHRSVAVLDGGFDAWQAARNPIETGQSKPYPAGSMRVTMTAARWADKAAVAAAMDARSTCTINALSPGVYAGTAPISYGRKGHIPGSVNVPYNRILDAGKFRGAEELEAVFRESGALDGRRVIAYCGGGISATVDAFALALIGRDDVAVYDGSMSEWAADASLPLREGAAP